MFEKILIANRGEIALRIIRSAQELDIKAVAIYEETDKDAFHIMRADEAICIGPGPRKDYLDIDKIIEAAKKTGAEAIHPGYGFLAENPEFPEACIEAGLVFIGPPHEVIRSLGSKVIARDIARNSDIPVIPATETLSAGEAANEEALAFAAEYGFPIMIKAVSGGGGRGIRQVDDERSLLAGLKQSRSEALMAFGNDDIYLEKCLSRPQHIEVQILADSFGNVVHLGTRNCSIQRRHQKLIEIAPAGLPKELTAEICDAAVRVAKASNYQSAGTVEFLVEPDGRFYFLEVNTRIQVEHTVTEMVTGIDIVREQLLIAMGEPISFSQKAVVERGYAIELRINAEDPKNEFLATPGVVQVYQSSAGHGVRLDGAIYQGYEIPPFYDSMMVKLTVYGFTWQEAVDRLSRALSGFIIIGVKTTIPFFQQIVNEPDFIQMKFDTSYLDTHPQLLDYEEKEREVDKIARLIAEINAYGYNPYAQ
ncbi:MAG: acetyl-CoA carboxylase biotin carboxylase subunit [Deltaproteobacteria bacterium]|nr:acetyl-CoA carboxylase biotin carboxylase subunit [Deltaproteobacteria bacterium]MBW2072629.1 acetyl-CoA carboxylase biotin carboxylase subunit [Deltaproteobacteria bacterium]